jgi:tetratricopeptide (TPR) repeat protein
VFVIDDLQWADEASLHLFHYLARHVESSRLLLVGICRSDRYDLQENGKPAPVLEILYRIRHEDLSEEITLSGLSREQCDDLIDKSLTPALFTEEFYEHMHVATKGNPLYITETLKLFCEQEVIFLKEKAWHNRDNELDFDVPDRIEDIFLRRLSALTEQEQEILQVAAVQGYTFDSSVIAKILEISNIELLKILLRLDRDAEVITTTDEGFRFDHPMLADSLYHEMPQVLLREYHAMIAAQLEIIYGPDPGTRIGDVAYHYYRGGKHDKAIPLLFQAGSRTFGLSAYREASLFFEYLLDSLKLSDQVFPETIAENDFYFKLGICYEESGRWQEALDAYKNLYDLSEKKSLTERGIDALLKTGRIHAKLSDWKLALGNFEECLRLAKEHNVSNVQSRAYNNMGLIFFQKGDIEQAQHYFASTIQSVDCELAQIDEAHALTNMGIIANIQGNHEEAMQNYDQALQIYEEKSNNQQQKAQLYHNLGMTWSDIGEMDKAMDEFKNCLKIATEIQDKQLRALTYLNMGKTLTRQNDTAQAKRYTEKALKIFKRMDDLLNLAETYQVLGLIFAAQPEFVEAMKYFNNCIRINQELGYQEGLAEAYYSFGKVCQEADEFKQAHENYQKALEVYSNLNIGSKIQEIRSLIEALNAKQMTVVEIENSDPVHNLGSEKTDEVIVETED